MEFSLTEIARSLHADIVGEASNVVVRHVSTDSRTLRGGELFVALRGTAFDAHQFVPEVVQAGACAVVVDHVVPTPRSIPQLVVPDTLYALGEIARLWRQKVSHVEVAALVGSSGKTTIKEMAAKLLSRTRPTLATEGNLNNLVGVPLTLFRLEPSHKAAVIELGMNSPGELRRLTEIVQPNCVVLSNIRNAHIGMFKSAEELYLAKVESLRYASPTACLILNADDPNSQRAYREFGAGRQVMRFGLAPEADVRAKQIEPLVPFGYAFKLVIQDQASLSVRLRMFGQHNVVNALAASAIARYFNEPLENIVAALEEFQPAHNRSQVEELGGIFIVKDYYNASPAAVESALLSLQDFCVPGRRYAVLGDMLELGSWEHMYHERMGVVAAHVGLTKLFCYGPRSQVTAQAAAKAGLSAEHFDDTEKLAQNLAAVLKPGDLLLIKGSRLMKLERVYDYLKGAVTSSAQ
ncbi:MAG: UDP-N-acetylmuramoyl-tripeptide--D-alanyl-D-alanine ligase [Candidatus Sumerlaeaceae bacterium]